MINNYWLRLFISQIIKIFIVNNEVLGYNFGEIDNRFQQEDVMKKLILPLLVLIIVLAACGNNGGSGKSDSKEETKSYKLDSGKTIKSLKIPNVLR